MQPCIEFLSNCSWDLILPDRRQQATLWGDCLLIAIESTGICTSSLLFPLVWLQSSLVQFFSIFSELQTELLVWFMQILNWRPKSSLVWGFRTELLPYLANGSVYLDIQNLKMGLVQAFSEFWTKLWSSSWKFRFELQFRTRLWPH